MTTAYSRAKARGPQSRFPHFARVAVLAWLLLLVTTFVLVPLGAPGGIDAAYRGIGGEALVLTFFWGVLVLAAGLAAAWLVARTRSAQALSRSAVIARSLIVWAVVGLLSYLPTAAMAAALSGMTGPQPESVWLSLATVLVLSGLLAGVAAFVMIAWSGINRMGVR